MQIICCEYLKQLTPNAVIGCGANLEFYKIFNLLSDLECTFESIWIDKRLFYDIFKEKLRKKLIAQGTNIDLESNLDQLTREGFDCEILSPSFSQWLLGKLIVKLNLDFVTNQEGISDESKNVSNDQDKNNHKITVSLSHFFADEDKQVMIQGLLGKRIYNLNMLKLMIEAVFNENWYIGHRAAPPFYELLISRLSRQGIDLNKNIFGEGKKCEIFDIKAPQYLTGVFSINFILDFIPHDLDLTKPLHDYESPLDEIRREMQQNIES